jgi:hypothetical protein
LGVGAFSGCDPEMAGFFEFWRENFDSLKRKILTVWKRKF